MKQEPEHETRLPAVCILSESFYPVIGGTETQTWLLGEDLVARGHKVLVVTRRSVPESPRREERAGMQIVRLPPSGGGPWLKWGLLLLAIPMLIRMRRHFDIIYVPGFRVLGLAAVVGAWLLRKRTVLRAASCGEMSGTFFDVGVSRRGSGVLRPCVRAFVAVRNRLLKAADAFVCVSSAIAEEVAGQRIAPERMHRIPNCVDLDRFSPVTEERCAELRSRLDLSRFDRIAVYTGRLVTYKGLPMLLDVWGRVAAEYPDAGLVIVGEGSTDVENCEDALHRTAEADGLSGSVVFTGAVRNVHEYLQAADVFVFPSENEAFGISVIEAMACGLPVITTPAGGLKDLVTAGETGWVVPVGDGLSVAAALDAAFRDLAAAAQMGRRAREQTASMYSREAVTDQYVSLFRSLLAPIPAASNG